MKKYMPFIFFIMLLTMAATAFADETYSITYNYEFYAKAEQLYGGTYRAIGEPVDCVPAEFTQSTAETSIIVGRPKSDFVFAESAEKITLNPSAGSETFDFTVPDGSLITGYLPFAIYPNFKSNSEYNLPDGWTPCWEKSDVSVSALEDMSGTIKICYIGEGTYQCPVIPKPVLPSQGDAVFGCDSNVEDFNNKRFDTLTVDLTGCREHGSAIFENADDQMVYFDGVQAADLIYEGGQDTADHYLFFKNSDLNRIWFPCENTHECHIGFGEGNEDANTKLTIIPTGEGKGKIHIHGNLLPYDNALAANAPINPEDFWTARLALPDEGMNDKSFVRRLNFIEAAEWTDDIRESLLSSLDALEGVEPYVPESFEAKAELVKTVAEKAEVELDAVYIGEMNVISPDAWPVMSTMLEPSVYMMNVVAAGMDAYAIESPYQPSKHEFWANSPNYGSVDFLTICANGTDFVWNADSMYVLFAEFFGYDHPSSRLVFNEGYKNHLRSAMDVLSVFGAKMKMEPVVESIPRYDNFQRLILAEMPDNNALENPILLVNELILKYGETAQKDANIGEKVQTLLAGWTLDNIPYEAFYTELGAYLIAEFSRDYPDKATKAYPAKLELPHGGGIMKLIVADRIADSYPDSEIFKFAGNIRISAKYFLNYAIVKANGGEVLYGHFPSIPKKSDYVTCMCQWLEDTGGNVSIEDYTVVNSLMLR